MYIWLKISFEIPKHHVQEMNCWPTVYRITTLNKLPYCCCINSYWKFFVGLGDMAERNI